MLRLEHWGCPWSREPDGHIAVRPFGGMKIERTWYAADKTGFHMLHSLYQTSLKYSSIHMYDEWFATKLLVDEGRCQGVVAIQLATGKGLLSRGPDAHGRFRELLESPAVLIFHGIVFIFLLFHSITWLNLAPKALVVRTLAIYDGELAAMGFLKRPLDRLPQL